MMTNSINLQILKQLIAAIANVGFGSKTDLNLDYQIISNMSAIRSWTKPLSR
jgi:hypothetical protein